MRLMTFILLLISSQAFCSKALVVEFVKVDKSERKLFLYSNGEVVKTYSVALGENEGPKKQEYDKKTPEGNYSLIEKKPNSKFHKAILISYPNKDDIANSKRNGVNPGGLIEIHGQYNSWWSRFDVLWQWKNWTDGCIALSNKDMDDLWNLVQIPTPIEITP